MLPTLAVSEVIDFSPWHGWSVMAPVEPGARIGPVQTPVGPCFICRGDDDTWWIERSETGTVLMKTNIMGRLYNLILDGDQSSAALPELTGEDHWISFNEA
jgi:hypothetical protein